VEIPEELQALSVMQSNIRLLEEASERGYWRPAGLTGDIVISASEGMKYKIPVDDDPCLIFKLGGVGQNSGRKVRRATSGSYLVIVPADWTRDEALSGSPPAMPEHVCIEGYRAHFFNVPQVATSIAFRDGMGRTVVVSSGEPRFRLTGPELRDAADNLGPLFGGSLPRISVADGSWRDVGTVVVGTEGRGNGRWRTSFRPNPTLPEQNLPSEIVSRKAGWYFVRFYDLQDELIDSLDFRFGTGLTRIRVQHGSPFPSSEGHGAVCFELQHDSGWHVHGHSTVSPEIRIERSDEVTALTIAPLQECDRSNWLSGPTSGPYIEVTILAERVWWGLGNLNAPPISWQDRCLSLSRSAFAPTSDQALWLRFPKPRWTNSVFVGFQEGKRREYELRVAGNSVAIPLRDFSDCQELSVPAENHDLKVWLYRDGNSYRATMGSVPSEVIEEPVDLAKLSACRLASVLTALHRVSPGPLRRLVKEVRRHYYRSGRPMAHENSHFREEALCVIALAFQLGKTQVVTPSRVNRCRSKARRASTQCPETMRQVWRRYRELTSSSRAGQTK
jgi:hypothetical protein